MDKDLEYIANSTKEYHSHLDYLIEARMDFSESPDWVDVTEMFTTPKQLRAVGITKKNRRIIAKNIVGYNTLIDLGFKEIEIIKEYK